MPASAVLCTLLPKATRVLLYSTNTWILKHLQKLGGDNINRLLLPYQWYLLPTFAPPSSPVRLLLRVLFLYAFPDLRVSCFTQDLVCAFYPSTCSIHLHVLPSARRSLAPAFRHVRIKGIGRAHVPHLIQSHHLIHPHSLLILFTCCIFPSRIYILNAEWIKGRKYRALSSLYFCFLSLCHPIS